MKTFEELAELGIAIPVEYDGYDFYAYVVEVEGQKNAYVIQLRHKYSPFEVLAESEVLVLDQHTYWCDDDDMLAFDLAREAVIEFFS